jgi:type I restriction enzyme R subunit
MMTEYGYVEEAMLEWLAGKDDDPNDHGLGWTYRSEVDMEVYGRSLTDPIVEALLIPALMRINRAVDTEDKARKVVDVLRGLLRLPDPLDANRRTLEALREGLPVVLASGEDATTVKLIEFDPDRQRLNDFTVTNQYRVRGSKTVEADTALLVNGIPVVLAEYKSYVNSGHDWKEGVDQLHRYQREAPALLVPNVFSVAADEQEFRYGAVAYQIGSQKDVDLQRDSWRPWLSQYPVRRLYWTLPAAEMEPDAVKAATEGLLRPCNVLDFIENFHTFETKRGKTLKKLARYQQFEAANDIVDRVVKGEDLTGLIWHTQGSGKTLTMVFAGYKLRRRSELANPTVIIVVDRRDLKKQLADDFDSCEYPNIARAMGVRDLREKIRANWRGTVITTLQCFQQMDDLSPRTGPGAPMTVLLIDEAHRSQKGKGAGFAMTMRAKLPEAFRFGLSGTPIDRTMVNTHRDFGPVKDGQQERYLSYYGIRRSITDGATLEVYYELRTVPIKTDEEPLSVAFEQMCEEMEVEEDEEKTDLQRKETRWKALARDQRRVDKIVANMVDHFLAHPDPNGFKAQLVAVDRHACRVYKEALDAEFKKRGLPPEWSDVAISQGQNDPPELERFHYTKDKTDDIIERFKMTRGQWEDWNRRKFGDDRSKWVPPMKVLIVCDRLLTGFDAPIEQVMYLDRPLRDHNLLQAMARTNRPFPEMGKRHGLIIDYFGVFESMQKALNFDEDIREEAVIDWARLKALVPDELERCMAFFQGIKVEDTRACLMASLRRLTDPQAAQEFETQFKRTEVLWEAVSPDECLYPHRFHYAWLCSIYVAHNRRKCRSTVTREELAAKTRELIQQHTTFMEIAEGVPAYKIGADYLTKITDIKSPADRAAELEAALTKELAEGQGGFLYKQLGDRLREVVERKAADDNAAVRMVLELEALVAQVNASNSEPARLGLTQPGEYPLFTVIRSMAQTGAEAIWVQAARTLMAELRRGQCLPTGWATTAGGRQEVSLALQGASWMPGVEELGLCPVGVTEPPFLAAAVEELARTTA